MNSHPLPILFKPAERWGAIQVSGFRGKGGEQNLVQVGAVNGDGGVAQLLRQIVEMGLGQDAARDPCEFVSYPPPTRPAPPPQPALTPPTPATHSARASTRPLPPESARPVHTPGRHTPPAQGNRYTQPGNPATDDDNGISWRTHKLQNPLSGWFGSTSNGTSPANSSIQWANFS